MNLSIKTARASGDVANERLVINVIESCDIGEYVVIASRRHTKGGAAAGPARCFWFPDKEVKPGDLVVLYSKRGQTSAKVNKSGSSSHFFYWGDTAGLWEKHIAVLGHIGDYTIHDLSPEDSDEVPPPPPPLEPPPAY